MAFLLHSLLWALQSGAAPVSQEAPAAPSQTVQSLPVELTGCVPDTRLFARLEVRGFTPEERHAKLMQRALGPRGVFVGILSAEQANLELVVDKVLEKQPDMTDAEWRDFNLKDSGSSWKYFEAAGLLGGETTIFFEGNGTHDFHAFAVRGGHCIDLHLGESWDKEHKPRLTREFFVGVASTFRLGVVRIGAWKDMPPRALELMDQALQRTGTWQAHLADLAKASPDDYAIPFAAAEIARFLGEPPARQVEGYSKAIELLAAKKDPAAPERVAQCLAEDGLALARLDANEPDQVLPHFESAQKIAADLPATYKAGVLFDRARAEARLGKPEAALERLKEAEHLEPGMLLRVLTDKDLASVRELKWFKDFLDGDRGNR